VDTACGYKMWIQHVDTRCGNRMWIQGVDTACRGNKVILTLDFSEIQHYLQPQSFWEYNPLHL